MGFWVGVCEVVRGGGAVRRYGCALTDVVVGPVRGVTGHFGVVSARRVDGLRDVVCVRWRCVENEASCASACCVCAHLERVVAFAAAEELARAARTGHPAVARVLRTLLRLTAVRGHGSAGKTCSCSCRQVFCPQFVKERRKCQARVRGQGDARITRLFVSAAT